MANRFIGGVLSSRPQANTPFSSRASTGTYFDSAGVMRTAPINQPRLNYNLVGSAWTQPSVLIEPASTNIITYSEQINNAAWSKIAEGSRTGVTANAATAPDGNTTADLVYVYNGITSVSGGAYWPYTFTNGVTYTWSCFFKYVGYQYVYMGTDNNNASCVWFNLSAGTVGSTSTGFRGTITNVGNSWYRCATTFTFASASMGNAGPIMGCANVNGSTTLTQAGTGSTGVYMWGAQLEVNSLGATSYIPTVASTVTRAADVVGPGTSGIFNLSDRQNTTANDDQFTVQSFTSTGSTSWTAPADVVSVEVLVVAGGGAGGSSHGGGGGGGEVLYNPSFPVTPGTTYPITVGIGGAKQTWGAESGFNDGGPGRNSNFGTLTAKGGQGGKYNGPGGASGNGYPGGDHLGLGNNAAGGGGGAGGFATPATAALSGGGGPGLQSNITGTASYYGGGGGATGYPNQNGGPGGAGGGGAGQGVNGSANTGGGGAPSADGGSGVVVIKYKRTPRQISSTSNAATVLQKFIVSNVWTAPAGVTTVEALVVAGGGGGGNGTGGGGGGAGGVVYSSALAVTPGSNYTIGVGNGGLGAIVVGGTTRNGTGSGIGSGSELITNGSNFTTGTGTTGWSATTATLSVPQNGIFQILPNASVNGTASQSITTVNGTKYLLVVNVLQDTTLNLRVRIGTTQVGSEIDDNLWPSFILTETAVGTGIYSTVFTATGATTWINLQVGGGTQQSTQITSISVRQAALSAFGGGGGGSESGTTGYRNGQNGGSGGGSAYNSAITGTGIAGQGNAGGVGYSAVGNVWTGGGGGGAGSAGGNATTFYPGYGGAGVAYAITGNLEYYGGGGGGSSQNYNLGTVYPGLGGIGGGGTGFADQTASTVGKGGNGAPNTGGGGGAQADWSGSENSGHGGSGVVVLRYRVPQVVTFQDSGAWTCPAGVTSVQALIVAGGGGGASKYHTGGGGAGGLLYSTSVSVTPGTTYPVVIGQGGFNEQNGKNSSFAGLVAIGGGYGGKYNGIPPSNGGSGGGAGYNAGYSLAVGQGVYGQGNNGGNITTGDHGGGGGGAGSAGSIGNTAGGAGGAGLQYSISGTATYYAGGGGGGNVSGGAGAGGVGGGGAGTSNTGLPGTQNTGGGGGGGERNETYGYGGRGGSGVVILRWVGA